MPCVQLHSVNKAGPLGLELRSPGTSVGHTVLSLASEEIGKGIWYRNGLWEALVVCTRMK